MDIFKAILNRRSVRAYDIVMPKKKLDAAYEKKLDKILKAGLTAPTGKSKRPFLIVMITEEVTLSKLVKARVRASSMLLHADACMLVFGLPEVSDTWIEDCSNVMMLSHLMADNLGLGSCWIQGRGREAESGEPTDSYVKRILCEAGWNPMDSHEEIASWDQLSLEAMLSIGRCKNHPEPHSVDGLSQIQANKVFVIK